MRTHDVKLKKAAEPPTEAERAALRAAMRDSPVLAPVARFGEDEVFRLAGAPPSP